jgi:hypothetical protein
MADINGDVMNQDLHRGSDMERGDGDDLGAAGRNQSQGFDPGVDYSKGAYSDEMQYDSPDHPQAKMSLRGEEDDRPSEDDSVFERNS